jgi:Flp pilus assembly protein TadG
MLAQFRSSTEGAIAAMTAILLAGLLGMAGVGIEFGHWYTVKRSMQSAADAAALSAGSAKAALNTTGFAAEADAVASQNGWGGSFATNDLCNGATATKVCVNSPPKYGNFVAVAGAIEVVIARPQASFLGRFTGYSSNTMIRVHAVVLPGGVATTGNGCLLALGTGNSISVQGVGNLTLSACDADGHGNISFSGTNARMSVRSFDIAGTVSAPSQLTVTGPAGTSNDHNPPADPYASTRSIGTKPGTCITWNGASPIPPGAYCGLNITKSVTLSSGIFYIEGGTFSTSGAPGTTITSAAGGVTIVLTSTAAAPTTFATVSTGGNAALNLTALSTGTTAGIVFYADPANTTNQIENFAGNSNNHVTGSFYFPHQTVSLSGNGGFSSPNSCFQIVALDVVDSGNGTLSNGCIGSGVVPIGGSAGSASRLVE